MAEVDSITQEAMRRAAHIGTRRSSREQTRQHERPHRENRDEPPREAPKPEPPPKEEKPASGLDAIFKDKETGIILLLIVLLMGEKNSEGLLLALIYLLT